MMPRVVGPAALVLAGLIAAADATPDLLALRVRRGDAGPVPIAQVAPPPAIVVFWASYCPPCRAEVPVLDRAADRWRAHGVHVLGVALGLADPQDVARTAHDWGMHYDVVWVPPDQNDLVRQLAPAGLPVTFFVGKGRVARYDRFLSDADLEALVPKLLRIDALSPAGGS
jgi:thiol-disulfide isomerase/thioredoxin